MSSSADREDRPPCPQIKRCPAVGRGTAASARRCAAMTADMPELPWITPELVDVLETALLLSIATAGALLVHRGGLLLLRRLAARTASNTDDLILARVAAPMRWIVVAVALSLVQRGLPLAPWALAIWEQATGFVLPGLIGWLAIALVYAV